jgi:hypothetical protein
MINKKMASVIALSLLLAACGGGGGDEGGSNNGGDNGGNNGGDNGGDTSTAAPTISITNSSKTGTIYGGDQFELTYVIADKDTATSSLIVDAVANSGAVSVSIDTTSKKVLVSTSQVQADVGVNITLTVSDGKNSSQAVHSFTLSSYSAEYKELKAAITQMKGMFTSETIKKEDTSTVDTLGMIAMSNGTMTADDFEIAKKAVALENDAFAANAMATLNTFETSLNASPSGAMAMLADFNQWKAGIMSNFSPLAFQAINNIAQQAAVAGLTDASVSDGNLISSESRYVSRKGYTNAGSSTFLKAFEWMYATEGGKRTECSI